MNKKRKIIYDIFFISIGILIVRWLDGGISPLSIQISLYLTAVASIYIWRNFTNWNRITRKRVTIILLVIIIVLGGLTFYVNNYMPKGEMIHTGYDDDRGKEIYAEDYRVLNIPNWAKVIKGNFSTIMLIIFYLALMSTVLYEHKEKQE